MSRLCPVCDRIKFAAVLTPRELDTHTREWRAIFRPECSGNGGDPWLGWMDKGPARKAGQRHNRPPHVQSLNYDELSGRTDSEDEKNIALGPEGNYRINESLNIAAPIENLSSSEDDEGFDKPDNHDMESYETSGSGSKRLNIQSPASISINGSTSDKKSDLERWLIDREIDHTVQNASNIEDESTISKSEFGQTPYEDRIEDPVSSITTLDDHGCDKHTSEDGTASSTWSTDSRFHRGLKIDIEKEALGNWSYEHGQFYNLGSIWDVRSRRNECEMCSKLWQRMRLEWQIKNTFLKRSRCILRLLDYKCKDSDERSKREISMLNMLFIFDWETHQGWNMRLSYIFQGRHKDTDLRGSIVKSGGTCPWQNRMFGESRAIGTSCDFELFRKWLKYCETQHKHEEPPALGEMTVRFIDVRQRCLVDWSGLVSKIPRYVALSYVWGVTPQALQLTTANMIELMQPGVLRSKVLSNTVRDAIDLVEQIGKTYLWIDALCILQDSSEDKLIQIPQMYNIYSKSTLTVIAANGNNADAGLPGVQKNSRPISDFYLDLDNIQVSIRATTELWHTPYNIGVRENYIAGCKYLTRGWTFQEAFLARRTIVFTRDQAYFECATCTWCEETHWESDSLNFVGQRAVKECTPAEVWADNFDRKAYDMTDNEEVTYEIDPNSYESLVREYTERSLTYEGDILNAFSGILSWIEKREETECLFALREKHFGNDLLFNVVTATARRKIVETMRVPTWSWLSWRGTIEFATEARNSSSDLVDHLGPCDGSKCYILVLDDVGKKSLRLINEGGGWRFRRDYVRDGDGIFDPTEFHPTWAITATNAVFQNVQSSQGLNDPSIRTAGSTLEMSDTQTLIDTAADSRDDLQDLPHTPEERSRDPCIGIARHVFHEHWPRDYWAKKASEIPSDPSEKEIPEYSQEVTMLDIEAHKAFPLLQPNFHVIFWTFSTTVELRTEQDDFVKRFSKMSTAGTKRHRRNGIMSFTDVVQRKLYLYNEDPRKEANPGRPRRAADRIRNMLRQQHVYHDVGPYFGRLPQLSKSWDAREYQHIVPDGIYTVLWMNNNQLPMLGHLLCRPSKSISGPEYGDGVLERVCGVSGPPDILTRKSQQKWRAKWGCHVLG